MNEKQKIIEIPAMSGIENLHKKNENRFCMACNLDLDKCECIWAAIRDLQKRLDDTQKRCIASEDIEDRLIYLENKVPERVGHLGNALHHLSEENHQLRNELSKTPHTCPNCHEFSSPDIVSNACHPGPRKHYIATNPCHSCNGKGIVWNS